MAFSAFLLWTREQPLLFPGCIDAVWPADPWCLHSFSGIAEREVHAKVRKVS